MQAKKLEASKAKNLSSQSGLFLISKAKKSFTELRQAFIQISILNHFGPECYIQIETNASGYTIDGILN